MLLHLLACGSAPVSPMTDCPASPNCVSSLADSADLEHHIAPFKATEWGAVVRAIEAQPGVTAHTATLDYRHYTFTTPILGFVDDLELQVRDHHLHIRSASRVGHSDLGVNRLRVDRLRAALAAGE